MKALPSSPASKGPASYPKPLGTWLTKTMRRSSSMEAMSVSMALTGTCLRHAGGMRPRSHQIQGSVTPHARCAPRLVPEACPRWPLLLPVHTSALTSVHSHALCTCALCHMHACMENPPHPLAHTRAGAQGRCRSSSARSRSRGAPAAPQPPHSWGEEERGSQEGQVGVRVNTRLVFLCSSSAAAPCSSAPLAEAAESVTRSLIRLFT